VFDEPRVAVTAATWIGIVADLESLVISATLGKWRADVPTPWHARRLRVRRAAQRCGSTSCRAQPVPAA
jgi:hypothetical protein